MVQCQRMVICSKHHIHTRIMHHKCRIILVLICKSQIILILIKYLRNISKIWLLCLKKLSVYNLRTKLLFVKNYPENFDSISYPQNYKVPEFIKFTGEDSRTTWEHVSQFNAQMGIYGSLDHLKIRMFPLSLSGTAFSCFSELAPNSVQI